MKYLLDTNVVSEPLRPKPSISIMRRLRKHDAEIAAIAHANGLTVITSNTSDFRVFQGLRVLSWA